MAIITSFGRETTRVAAENSLVSDMRTCSLISDTGNMPGRINRCDIVRARDLSEIFHLIIALFVSGIMCLVIYTTQLCGSCYFVRA